MNNHLMGANAIPRPRFNRDAQHTNDTSDESYLLLLEFASQEPTVQACYRVIESTCLSQGIQIRIKGSRPSDAFNRHLCRHYVSFCGSALRSMFTCGFVPWR